MEIFAKSQAGTQQIGVYGAIAILAGGLLLALSMGGAFLLIPLIYAAVVCLLFSREAFRDLRQIVVLVPVVIVVSTLLWQAEYIDPSPMATATSSPFVAGFIVGVEMSVRAVVTVLAVSVFVRTSKVSDLTYLIESVSGSKSFSFVLGLAFNIRPYLERISRDTLNAIKMRGGFTLRNMASSISCLLSSTTLNALAKCQDISYAAEARAFGSEMKAARSAPREQMKPSRTDLAIIITTVILVVLSFVSKA
jgi:energy-coupling factor transporter transmembrane protein EcfT